MGKIKRTDKRKQLIMQSLKQEIAFMPGSIFGAKDGYIRLSYGKVNIDKIEEGFLVYVRLFWFVEISSILTYRQ